MTHFLTDLETEVQRQNESATQLIAATTALAASRQAQKLSSLSSGSLMPPVKKCPSQFCQNGVHNPEATGQKIKGVIAKLKAQSSNQALLSVNSGTANAIVLDSGSVHYVKPL